MKSAVIVFPGSNRDADMVRALTLVSGQSPERVWYQSEELPQVDLVVLPGGFSYGDYLRAGSIAARAPVMPALAAHAARGGYVLGVCNGFQILCEAELLPGILMRNADQRFICREVHLRVETTDSAFTSRYTPGQVIRCPVAHGEGNYRCSENMDKRLADEDRIAFRYATADGAVADINGSVDGIAGILSENRRVLGMMPHPENLVEPVHGGTDGRPLFESVVDTLVEAA